MQATLNAAFIISLSVLVSRVLGFVRETLLAAVFGATLTADAFFVSQTIPLLFASMAIAVGSMVLLPAVARLWAGDRERANRLALTGLAGTAAFLGAMTLLVGIFAPAVVRLMAPGFPEEGMQMAVLLTRWSLPSLFFLGLAGVLTSLLQARHSFTLPATASLPQNLILIAAILGAGFFGGIVGVAAATGLAALVQSLLLFGGLRPAGYRPAPVLPVTDGELRKLLPLLPPVLILAAMGMAAPVLQRILGSGLDGGSIAALNYATRVYMLPQGIFSFAVVTTLYPALAEASSFVKGRTGGGRPAENGNGHAEFLHTFRRGLRTITFLLLPMAAGLIVLREPVIRVLFQRGAFDAAATEATAFALALFALGGILPSACVDFVNRAFYAMSDTRTPMLGGLVNIIVMAAVSLAFLNVLGHGALALGTSAGPVVVLGLQLFLLRRRTGPLGGRFLAEAGSRMLVATAVFMLVIGLWQSLVYRMLPPGLFSDLVVLLAGGAAGAIAYGGVALFFQLEELGFVMELVSKLARRFLPYRLRRAIPGRVRGLASAVRRRAVM